MPQNMSCPFWILSRHILTEREPRARSPSSSLSSPSSPPFSHYLPLPCAAFSAISSLAWFRFLCSTAYSEAIALGVSLAAMVSMCSLPSILREQFLHHWSRLLQHPSSSSHVPLVCQCFMSCFCYHYYYQLLLINFVCCLMVFITKTNQRRQTHSCDWCLYMLSPKDVLTNKLVLRPFLICRSTVPCAHVWWFACGYACS